MSGIRAEVEKDSSHNFHGRWSYNVIRRVKDALCDDRTDQIHRGSL